MCVLQMYCIHNEAVLSVLNTDKRVVWASQMCWICMTKLLGVSGTGEKQVWSLCCIHFSVLHTFARCIRYINKCGVDIAGV